MKTKFKIKEFLGHLAVILAEKSFLVSLLVVFLAMSAGAFLFYNRVILTSQKEPSAPAVLTGLAGANYQEVTDIWQKADDNFKRADFKNYLNIFQAR
jgi:hypothetical protein